MRGTYTHGHGTALAAGLGGDSVRVTEVVTPVSTTDGHDRELGDDDGGANGGGHFLGRLDS